MLNYYLTYRKTKLVKHNYCEGQNRRSKYKSQHTEKNGWILLRSLLVGLLSAQFCGPQRGCHLSSALVPRMASLSQVLSSVVTHHMEVEIKRLKTFLLYIWFG